MLQTGKKWLFLLVLLPVAAGVAWAIWENSQPERLGEAFASGNGRIEATEVDVATKLAGRVAEIFVDEGDFVTAGQIVAQMDTAVLEAQLAQAEAEVSHAQNAQRTAEAMVALRKSEREAAEAVVVQREAEFVAAEKRYQRTERLFASRAVSEEELENNRAAMQSSKAAVAAAKSQVHSAEAGVLAAESQVIEAASRVKAAQAAVARIQSDIEDSRLKAPRDGRVQYRVAQVGEVLPAGGVVLNMVDLSDVYMTFFLPTAQAGRVALGQEVRLVLDAIPEYVIPAKVTFVASVAQFTPKTVETASERAKLMFRIKANIPEELLKKHITQVKTGLPGMAYLKLDPQAEWPDHLAINVPQ